MDTAMERRTFLASSVSLVGTSAFVGCLETQSAWRNPPLVENRPNAVYYPTITEGMAMYGMAMTDDIGIALMYTYPHRFWVVTGDNKNKVVVQDDDSLHLMVNVWDRTTATIVPTSVSIDVTQNEETVDKRSLWPMLSPAMGFHYGDNLSLDGEGEYTARVSVAPMLTTGIGALDGTLTESQTVEIPFEFDTSVVYNLPIRRYGEKTGTIGEPELMKMSMENMDMNHESMDMNHKNMNMSHGNMNMDHENMDMGVSYIPLGVVPPKPKFPGNVLGMASASKGRAEFVVSAFNNASRFGTNGRSYLAVSPRTPFNRILLPMMSISVSLTRNGQTVFEGPLRSAVGPAMSYHYGTAIDSVESGDELVISTQVPPQTARHAGYETVFIDMPDVQMTL